MNLHTRLRSRIFFDLAPAPAKWCGSTGSVKLVMTTLNSRVSFRMDKCSTCLYPRGATPAAWWQTRVNPAALAQQTQADKNNKKIRLFVTIK
jgi:hypothetical protein